MSPDGKGCVDRNECLDRPCLNGARCENLEPRLRYRCVCLDGFYGENCELIQEGQTLKLSMGALAAILVCLLIILSECSVGRLGGSLSSERWWQRKTQRISITFPTHLICHSVLCAPIIFHPVYLAHSIIA